MKRFLSKAGMVVMCIFLLYPFFIWAYLIYSVITE